MTRFQALTEGVEVSGAAVCAVAAGVDDHIDDLALILARHHIGELDPERWYPHQAWLDAFADITDRLGEPTVYAIGRSIPMTAHFPADIHDIHSGLAAIDVAYHMNHRLDGIPMYDPVDQSMLAGIGHYRYERIDERTVDMVVNTPYPCDFDRGIVAAMAERNRPPDVQRVELEHNEGRQCRKRGHAFCTYTVCW